ncbi:flagellar hook-associated protein FlgL [Aliifodinibius sp. S!AR15-10]|uniref:flagellar hook-associated protein FlgL n=1 Tax=Aliifodinibius sp. S!AR15-10 TaxID=2950437 RepID=UPI00285935F5|nr:flagellar hook-associated protein FlgL [Aliifodinibius sp. S!AR15-10]MDR8394644.1 flagellar hook-associated protein FlgL [Aliifodinibius sp. S!AR15-10]
MRITQKTMFSNFMRDINKNRSEMAELQSDLSSGRSVRFPSQDPVSFQSSRIMEEDIKKTEQYQGNINSGLRQASLSQGALDGAIDGLIQLKEIAVQGASSSLGENQRENLADKVAGVRKNLVNTLNREYGERQLFAGTNSDTKPFELQNDGTVVNNSNDTAPTIIAGDGVKIDISVSGEEIADTEAGDLFEVIGDLEQSLRDNDADAVSDMIPKSDKIIEHVTDLTSRLGDNINRMEFMNEQYESTKITQKSHVSKLVDTDYAQAFSELQRNQVAFESAMAVHSNMFKNTLLDYL